ncbi:hypothetical protein H8A95_21950 [Bradyrhizobium sp. Pear76]|uniref:hypothetical protein n=1 Tax=Bradyrhizobium oropedii TaxID=1571201 RepID=UPI001E5044A5|nr:hypothetical protein [Bradyrhizobium oropedii]MCC8964902.1 hypothetical protein [Bradyrhizobium oropedii]
MTDQQTSKIIGLKHEIKAVRAKARELRSENDRWRDVCVTLQKLAGLDDTQYGRLLQAASLPIE